MRAPFYRRAAANRDVLFNAGSLLGTTAVNSALGLAYWWLAARQLPPAAVGMSSAGISAIALLGTLGMLGIGTLLIGELPRMPEQRGALIATAVLVAGIAGSVLGLSFAILAPHLSTNLRPLGSSPWGVALCTLGSGLTAATLVLDQAMIGLLRGELQLWRNALFGVAKLGALALAGLYLAQRAGLTIFATWVAGQVVCLVAFGGLALWKGGPLRSFRLQGRLLRGMGLKALRHHLLNVALQLTGLATPLLVTVVLSSTANAYFYAAWMVASLIYLCATALGTVLYAVSAAEPGALAARMRFTLGLSLALGVAINCALLVGAGLILGLLGHAYAQYAAWPLRILALGIFPVIIREHYVAIRRVHGCPAGATPLVLTAALLKLVLAALGAHLAGLLGLCVGSLAVACIEALVMAPVVYGAAREARPQRRRGWQGRWYGLWVMPSVEATVVGEK